MAWFRDIAGPHKARCVSFLAATIALAASASAYPWPDFATMSFYFGNPTLAFGCFDVPIPTDNEDGVVLALSNGHSVTVKTWKDGVTHIDAHTDSYWVLFQVIWGGNGWGNMHIGRSDIGIAGMDNGYTPVPADEWQSYPPAGPFQPSSGQTFPSNMVDLTAGDLYGFTMSQFRIDYMRTVPEPASIGLLSLSGLALLRRKSRNGRRAPNKLRLAG